MSEEKGMVAGAVPALQGVSMTRGWTIPASLEQAANIAQVLSTSSMVPKCYEGKPGDILAAVMMGAEVGLSPMQALQNIAVINGRPSVWGDAMLAIVQSSGLLESIDEMDQNAAAKAGMGRCTVRRRGDPSGHTVTFSRTDAECARLWGKAGPWTTNPGRMLQLRARAFALRDKFADALRGIASAEEVSDYEVVPTIAAPTMADMMPRSRVECVPASVVAPVVVRPTAAPVVGSAVVEQAAQHVQPVGELLDIVNVVAKTSKAGKQYHEISLSDGTVATTFSATVVAAAERARGEGMRVRVSLKTKDLNGRIFHNIDTMECVTEEAGSNEIPF